MAIKSYKGFDKNLRCRDFQYKIGGIYEMDGEIKVCSRGFHACESPFDVFDYYTMIDSRFCEVEQDGNISKEDRRTKICSSKIKIKTELKLADMINLGIEWLKEITLPEKIKTSIKDNSSGNYAQIGSSGDGAKIGSSGNNAQIGSSGNNAKIGSSGDGAKIGSSGYDAKIGSSGNEAGKNICFMSRGEYADPKIAYNGILMNYWDVYDCMDEVEEPTDDDWLNAVSNLFDSYTYDIKNTDVDKFKMSDVMNVYRIINL